MSYHLPNQLVETLTTWGGWMSASSPKAVDNVRSEIISRWVVKQYPQRPPQET
ncbi:hypothetical protein ACF3DV_26370 [Chlorogloeopsis fritschii PCC 9212]|nr:hypothetical protein [Chlorogloeopsis fritschii]